VSEVRAGSPDPVYAADIARRLLCGDLVAEADRTSAVIRSPPRSRSASAR